MVKLTKYFKYSSGICFFKHFAVELLACNFFPFFLTLIHLLYYFFAFLQTKSRQKALIFRNFLILNFCFVATGFYFFIQPFSYSTPFYFLLSCNTLHLTVCKHICCVCFCCCPPCSYIDYIYI